MKYTSQSIGEFDNISMSERLTFSDYGLMKDIVDYLITNKRNNVRLNLTNLEFIDSSGLGMMLVLNEVAERNRIKFSIYGANGEVRRTFELSKLYRYLNNTLNDSEPDIAIYKPATRTLEDDIYKLEVEDAKMGMLIDLLVETMEQDRTIELLLVEFYSLKAVTSMHFKHEAAAMCKWQYQNIDDHISAHDEMDDYVDGVIAFLEAANITDSTDTKPLSDFTVNWHSAHAREHDGKFVKFLKGLLNTAEIEQ